MCRRRAPNPSRAPTLECRRGAGFRACDVHQARGTTAGRGNPRGQPNRQLPPVAAGKAGAPKPLQTEFIEDPLAEKREEPNVSWSSDPDFDRPTFQRNHDKDKGDDSSLPGWLRKRIRK